jgi:hypothetical protein
MIKMSTIKQNQGGFSLREHPKGSNAKYKDLTNYFEKMPPTPKTLQVFLPEGTPAGILIA